MNTAELFKTYPKAAELIVNYYSDFFAKSLENTDIPEEFKEFAREQSIDDQYVTEVINNTPRVLFDVFDLNQIYVQISVDIENKCFRYSFDGGLVESNDYNTRVEAETAAFETAFEILNNNLCQTK